jgi:tRNA pseudouridine55 synthase
MTGVSAMTLCPDAHIVRDGVLSLNKSPGWTSHDVVARLRKLLGGIKVGHAGTLDPAATGVLPILLGKGTRIAEYLLDWDKEYRAVLRLGETTDTLDATGMVLDRRPLDGVNEEAVHAATAAFRGRIRQMPPMYSAVKVRGIPLYKSARRGQIVERAAREVIVHRLDVEQIRGRDVFLRIHCSKGTYIRTLCADIGEALHVGGHLLSLERSKVGPLAVEQARTVEEVEAQVRAGMGMPSLLSLDAVLDGLPACTVDAETARKVLHGVAVAHESVLRWECPADQNAAHEKPVRIKDSDGRLLAIGCLQKAIGCNRELGPIQRIAVKKLLVSEEPAVCIS